MYEPAKLVLVGINWLKRNILATFIISGVLILGIGVAVGYYLPHKAQPVTIDNNSDSSSLLSVALPTPQADTTPAPTEPAKPQQWGDGTYEVGRDIPAGVYVANGTNCYWKTSTDSNGRDIIASNFGDGQQIVTLTSGTFFNVQRCAFTART